MEKKKEKLVICVYNDNAPFVGDKILEAFERYLKETLQNSNIS